MSTPLTETSDCLYRSAHRLNVAFETKEERLELSLGGRRTVVDWGRAEIRRHDEGSGVSQVVHERNCYPRSESIDHFEDGEEEVRLEEWRLEM
jgi:hypothetical protein